MKNIINERPLAYSKLMGRPKYLCDWLSGVDENTRILNIGCGFGWLELYLAEFTVALEIQGIDIDPHFFELLNEFQGYPHVKFTKATALNLPFPDCYFDICVASEVIEHIPKGTEDQFFKEINRVLKPAGTLYLTTPSNNFRSVLTDPAYFLIGHRHYSSAGLAEIAGRFGLSLSENFIKGAFWDCVYIWNLYIAKWIFFTKPFLNNFFRKKINHEYYSGNGFMTLFCKYIKNK